MPCFTKFSTVAEPIPPAAPVTITASPFVANELFLKQQLHP